MNGSPWSVRDLSVRFRLPGDKTTALYSVSFDMAPGEVLGIVGESASGKSQIVFALMGLLAVNGLASGEVWLRGQKVLGLPQKALDRMRGASLSMIYQDRMTSLNPYMRAGNQLAEGLFVHQGLSLRDAFTVAMLDRVRIPDAANRARRYRYEFSCGVQQRIMIAMALLVRPTFLLADEPTMALDVTIQTQVLDLMAELGRETGTSMVLVTHDLGVVTPMCDRVMVLHGGRKIEEAGAEALFAGPRHPYSQGLLAATSWLTHALSGRMGVIACAPLSGGAGPGRPFAPRCVELMAVCNVHPAVQDGIVCHRVAR